MADRTLEQNNTNEQWQPALGKKRGNIQISQDAEGALTVEILPRRNRAAFKMAVVLVVFVILTVCVIQFVLMNPRHGQRESQQFIDILHVVQAVDIIWTGYMLAALYTGRRKLTLSLRKLEICSFLLGYRTSRKSFACSDIKDLRYDQWTEKYKNKTTEYSGIRFEVGAKTHAFGTLMAAQPAAEIISRVREICPAIVRQS